MSVHVQPALRAPARRTERFDIVLVSVAVTALAVLWAAGSAHGTSATTGAVAAGAVTASAMVSAQVRVGVIFYDDGRFVPVGLLLVAVTVWFGAAVLAALGMVLTVPFTIATAVLLTGALTR